MPKECFPIFTTVEDASLLAKAIVDTVREPLVVLDRDLKVIVASRRCGSGSTAGVAASGPIASRSRA